MTYWICNNIHWYYVKWRLLMCSVYGWGVMGSISNAVRGSERVKWEIFGIFYFFFKKSPSSMPSSYLIRLHFRNFQQLWMFSFMIHRSWASVLKLSRGGENKPWKRFVPARVSNSNLRTFKGVHIHLMHTYHWIKQQPRFPPLTVNWKTGNDCLWKSHCFSKAFCSQTTRCIPPSMKLTNQNSRSRSTFGSYGKNFKMALLVSGNELMFSFGPMWKYCLSISQLTGNFFCVCESKPGFIKK